MEALSASIGSSGWSEFFGGVVVCDGGEGFFRSPGHVRVGGATRPGRGGLDQAVAGHVQVMTWIRGVRQRRRGEDEHGCTVDSGCCQNGQHVGEFAGLEGLVADVSRLDLIGMLAVEDHEPTTTPVSGALGAQQPASVMTTGMG